MKKIVRTIPLVTILLGSVMVSGCTTPESMDTMASPTSTRLKNTSPTKINEQTVPTPSIALPTSDVTALKEGIALYGDGDYNGAIKRLSTADEIWAGGFRPIQLDVLKYIAFSYCLTARQTLCRAQFEKALKLNPAFDLAPGEKGHPLWGPIFERAKKKAKTIPPVTYP